MIGLLVCSSFLVQVFHRPEPKMLYADNGTIKVGIDLNMGGSITYLAPSKEPTKNVVNSCDLGRQIQLSFYSGPVPFQPTGAKVSEQWKFLGWNPIQTGDVFGHSSKILGYRSNNNQLYVKCIPMHWPLDNVPGECEFEVWLDLEDDTVKAHCRLTNKRPDHTAYPARAQELPAVYVNAPYCHLMTYDGRAPFTHDRVTEIKNRLDKENHWATWLANEHWAAQVDATNWGLGVWNEETSRFSGGFFSEPGAGGPTDSPTGYIAPNRTEILDHNIVYDFSYALILGKLNRIRDYAYLHSQRNPLPTWSFSKSREGWSYGDAVDYGWPIRGELHFYANQQSVALVSPELTVRESSVRSIEVEASISGVIDRIGLSWREAEDPFTSKKEIRMKAVPDGKFRTYRFPINAKDSQALINQFRLTFELGSPAKNEIRIRRIAVHP